MRIVCDEGRCWGCLTCVAACLDQHARSEEAGERSGRIHEKRQYPSGLTQYVTRSCLHCEDAPCMSACPAGALRRDDQGFVVPDRGRCIGCRACAAACPHGVPRFDGAGRLVKCDGCAPRVSDGLSPACVAACPAGALRLE